MPRNPHLPYNFKRQRSISTKVPGTYISRVSAHLCSNKELTTPGADVIISAELWYLNDCDIRYINGCVIDPENRKIYRSDGSEFQAANVEDTINEVIEVILK